MIKELCKRLKIFVILIIIFSGRYRNIAAKLGRGVIQPPRTSHVGQVLSHHRCRFFRTRCRHFGLRHWPRGKVQNYRTPEHGITEEHVIDQMDEYDNRRIVNDILAGAVVVGHNLREQLLSLRADISIYIYTSNIKFNCILNNGISLDCLKQ